tara:strand:- start:409 stop:645 length:237 start_codon:yes stop_codon:yes gene_type:complete
MIIENEQSHTTFARWIPSTGEFNHHGWLHIGEDFWIITNIHSFDDLGATMDTFTIELDGETMEIYSYDEGETFTTDAY